MRLDNLAYPEFKQMVLHFRRAQGTLPTAELWTRPVDELAQLLLDDFRVLQARAARWKGGARGGRAARRQSSSRGGRGLAPPPRAALHIRLIGAAPERSARREADQPKANRRM